MAPAKKTVIKGYAWHYYNPGQTADCYGVVPDPGSATDFQPLIGGDLISFFAQNKKSLLMKGVYFHYNDNVALDFIMRDIITDRWPDFCDKTRHDFIMQHAKTDHDHKNDDEEDYDPQKVYNAILNYHSLLKHDQPFFRQMDLQLIFGAHPYITITRSPEPKLD